MEVFACREPSACDSGRRGTIVHIFLVVIAHLVKVLFFSLSGMDFFAEGPWVEFLFHELEQLEKLLAMVCSGGLALCVVETSVVNPRLPFSCEMLDQAIPNGAVVQKLNRALGVSLPKAKEKRKPVQ